SNRQLLDVSLVLGIVALGVAFLGYLWRDRLSEFRLMRWFSLKASRARRQSSSGVSNVASEGGSTSEKSVRRKTPEEEANEWLTLLPMLWLVIPAMFVGLLSAIKAILYLWDPSLSEKLQWVTVLWAGFGLGILYALPMSSLAWR